MYDQKDSHELLVFLIDQTCQAILIQIEQHSSNGIYKDHFKNQEYIMHTIAKINDLAFTSDEIRKLLTIEQVEKSLRLKEVVESLQIGGMNPFGTLLLNTLKCKVCHNLLRKWEVTYFLSIEAKSDFYDSLIALFKETEITDFQCVKCAVSNYRDQQLEKEN